MIDNWFKTASNIVDEALFVISTDGKVLYLNNAAQNLTALSLEEALNKNISKVLDLKNRDGSPFKLDSIMKDAVAGNGSHASGVLFDSEDGIEHVIEIRAEPADNKNSGSSDLLLSLKDLSRERSNDELLVKSERHFRMLIENISDLISIISTDGFILFVSPSVKWLLGYGTDELIGERSSRLIHEEDFKVILEKYKNEWMSGSDLIRHECRLLHKNGGWRDFESVGTKIFNEKGNLSSIVLNSRDITERRLAEDEIKKYRFHLEELVNERTEKLEDANRRLQDEILMRQKSDEELKKSLLQLKKTLNGTVQAIAMTVEARDLYTAGHQRRVAQLSEAIAREMGLDNDRVQSIQMAGVIHDLGKIYIPSEILTRPGKLTNEEFNLIKIHPTVGYNILSTIEFPWPIDKIVYQHHERMDGSGYPRGLSGKDILMESRIIAVADVVEAMTNHRPYRASLGLDVALKEISDNSGSLFDRDAADACTSLFRSRKFSFQ